MDEKTVKAINNLGVKTRYLINTAKENLDEPIANECIIVGKEVINSVGIPDNLIILSEISDYQTPGLASIILKRLGLHSSIPFFNLQGTACGSFPRALELSKNLSGRTLIIISGITSCLYQPNIEKSFVDTMFGFLFGDAVAGISVINENNPKFYNVGKHKHLTNINEDYQKASVYRNKNGFGLVSSKKLLPLILDYCDGVMSLMNINNLQQYERVFLHTGSKKIIGVLQERYKLTDMQLKPSRDILTEYGNTTGCSLPLVLNSEPKTINKSLLIGISMGFTVDMVELF